MEDERERVPYNLGDEVEFLMLGYGKFRGVVDCICSEWVRLKDGRELRYPCIVSILLKKKADIAKEAEEFLAKEKCPESLRQEKDDQRKKS